MVSACGTWGGGGRGEEHFGGKTYREDHLQGLGGDERVIQSNVCFKEVDRDRVDWIYLILDFKIL